jgi:preprotein translocase subunit SecD
VLFVETKAVVRKVTQADGSITTVIDKSEEKYIINIATIRGVFGNQFQITGLDSPAESSELALLMRSGALAAPMYFVEERTIGPSLGKANIDAGLQSALIGFALVVFFMLIFYARVGIFGVIALSCNLMLLTALLGLFNATLTLPGIAGIVLTIGMAVDSNVLIFEHIREEVRSGRTPVSAIDSGFTRALTTIIDSNLTTLFAAAFLYGFGSGPVRGFAVTLGIGILTSMFTAITLTRLMVITWLRRSRPKSLSI